MKNLTRPKRQFNIFIPSLVILGFILGVIVTNYVNWFNQSFQMRSPIIFQSIIISRQRTGLAGQAASPSALLSPTPTPSTMPTPPGQVSK